MAVGSDITATGGSNTVKIYGSATTNGTIAVGRTGTLGNNLIEITGGTNSGNIVAEGDKNTVTISNGTNSSNIRLRNEEHTINITGGNSNNDVIVAEGSKNKINISGGTNNGGSIDAQGNENELTIIGGTTGTKIDLGANASGEGKNKITIAGGTNSSDIDADGGLNIINISNGINSGNITAGMQNNGRGDNQVLISGGNTSTDISTAGSNNLYDQKGGTITSTSVVDMASGAGERDTHVKIYDNAQMDGTIHAHDGLIEVWTSTANITGDITASHADADTEWRLSGGNFSSTSQLTSVANGTAKNIFTISRDANLNNTTDAIHTSGTGTTEMTIKEMYQSNTNAISGTIILATNHNVLNLLGGAHITSAGVLDIRGKESNTITFDLNSTNGGVWTQANIGAEFANYTFSNLLDLTHPDTINAVNTANIKSGNLDRGAAGGESIRGAGVGGTTSYHITGGTTRYINTNSGTGHLYYSGGTINITAPTTNSSQVFNVRDSNISNKETLGNSGTTITYNTGDYLAYTILNVGETSGATPTGGLVTIKGGATVTLGVMDYNDNDMSNANRYGFAAHSVGTATGINGNYNYGNHAITVSGSQFEAQISASHVLVEGGGNFIIHENYNNWGKTESQILTSENRNIIDDLTIQGGGHVTLDRTSIHGSSGTGSAVVTVSTEGFLHGFGHYTTADNHNPLRANVDGQVVLESGVVDMSTGWVLQRGGTLQPYNASLFELGAGEKDTDVVRKLMGVVFESSNEIVFNPTSYLSTRMFHQHDAFYDVEANQITIDGDKNKLYYSDSIISKDFDFSAVWGARSVDTPLSTSLESKIAQRMKVQYDPVFGFDYELKSKLDFQLY